MIVIGLYSVLWGKNKENKEIEAEITITEGTKCCVENGGLKTVNEEGVEINDIEMQKVEATKVLRVTIISAPKL